MKPLKSIVACLLYVASTLNAFAQEVKLENSVLWKVEHPSLEKPSYIFGTIHMICPDDFQISEKIDKAMTSVDALVLEIDLSDPEEMKSMQASMIAKQKISEELNDEQFKKLDSLVHKVLNMPLANLDGYGVSMLNMILISKMLPCLQLKSYEMELMQMAEAADMPIYSLEKVAEQLAIVSNAYPTEFAYQQMMLFDNYKKDFNEAIQAYKAEDISTSVSLITKPSYMDENAKELMQVKRNQNWVQKMPSMMQERSNLFAVGAAHLTNSYGIIQLLREKGYTVSPVFN